MNPLLSYVNQSFRNFAHSGERNLSHSKNYERLVRINQSILICIIAVSANMLNEIRYGLNFTVLADVVFIFSLIITFWLNRNGKNLIATTVLYLSMNAIITVGNYLEGMAAGNYLIFVPIILGSVLLVGVHPAKYELFTWFMLTFTCTVVSFYFFPKHSVVQQITEAMEKEMYFANFLIAIFGSFLLALMTLQMKTNREQLIINEQRFSDAVFNNSANAVVLVNPNNNSIINVNKKALQLFEEYDKDTFLQSNLTQWIRFTSNFMLPEFIINLEASESAWQGKIVYKKKEGDSFIGHTIVSLFEHDQSRYIKINIADISEMRKAQNEAKIAGKAMIKAVNTKSRFLSTMSHELRTPLNGIIGTVQLMLQDAQKNIPVQQLEVLKNCSEQMLALINDVLDFNKIEANKITVDRNVFDAQQLLHSVCNNFLVQANAKNIQLQLQMEGLAGKELLGDDFRLSQILNNLLSNALKFTHQGSIVLKAQVERSNSEQTAINFSVVDTGIGIPTHKIKGIFESFTQASTSTTRKYGGTGLGLAITQKLVQLLGGDLEVESEEGKGSRFYFTLSFDNSISLRRFVNEDRVKTLKPFDGIKILLAEDNPVNMMIARRFLSKWNAHITEVSNGYDAVEMFNRNSYDLLLFDLEMPIMDGYTALEEIRKINRQIPAIAFTAAVFDNMKQYLREKGFSEYVQKPFRPEDLHQKIATLIIAAAS
jgi:PAS domain S-box-containing protein